MERKYYHFSKSCAVLLFRKVDQKGFGYTFSKGVTMILKHRHRMFYNLLQTLSMI